MVVSSMAQDIIKRGAGDSELESINGYILQMAEDQNLKAPYNRSIYELCTREFAKESFTPMDVEGVWSYVKQRL